MKQAVSSQIRAVMTGFLLSASVFGMEQVQAQTRDDVSNTLQDDRVWHYEADEYGQLHKVYTKKREQVFDEIIIKDEEVIKDESKSMEKPVAESETVNSAMSLFELKGGELDKVRDFEYGMSAEELAQEVNKIPDKNLRLQVIMALRGGDTKTVQLLAGERVQSHFASNTVSRSVSRTDLKKLQTQREFKSLEQMKEDMTIPMDVIEAVQRFQEGGLNNFGKNYVIISKTNMTMYLMTVDHILLECFQVLTGKHANDRTYQPYGGRYNKNTPGGWYVATRIDAKESQKKLYGYETQGHFIELMGVGEAAYNPDFGVLGIHGVMADRIGNLNDGSFSNNRVTNGCINVPRNRVAIVEDHLKPSRSRPSSIFITSE